MAAKKSSNGKVTKKRPPANAKAKGAAQGSLWSRIQDASLCLAILDQLRVRKKLELPAQLAATGASRLKPAVVKALCGLGVSDALLGSLKQLWWDGGGHHVQQLVYPLWHGEDETFIVRTLAGLEHLSALEDVHLYTDAGLEPLLSLSKLKKLWLLVPEDVLRANETVLEVLRKRKVKISIERFAQRLPPRAYPRR